MKDVFYQSNDKYVNQLNPVKGYLEQLTTYIQHKKNVSYEQAQAVAKQIIKDKFKDRTIKYFEREENGDRVVKDGTLMGYIRNNISNKNILVPTFTSYVNTRVKKSVLSDFIAVNVKERSIDKKAGQAAKAAGDMETFILKNNGQNVKKTRNNSLSGVFGQSSCILHNPTAHNTLTSITRTMTSMSNASNEQFVAGNRYFQTQKDVMKTVIYIATYLDLKAIKLAVEKYDLHLPSVAETVKVLKYSSDLYFDDDGYYQTKVIPFLESLTPYHLAGVCYCGDLYHIRKFNDGFMRNLVDRLITRVDDVRKMDNPMSIHKVDESILNFVHTIYFSTVKGYGKDYEKMNEASITASILKTAQNVMSVFMDMKDFFNAFFMTELFPANSFRLKNMRRRTVVLSDTDSTCFTLDEWVIWHRGGYVVDDASIALAGCLSYMVSQTIVHKLAIISRRMNVEDALLNTLAMKNEFLWAVHVPAPVSKHYFAYTLMQEGSVFKEPELEVKGVHLKNSAVPVEVVSHGKEIMEGLLKSVSDTGKLHFKEILNKVITLEKQIIESVQRGETEYLKKSKIKNKEAYSQDEMKSPYQRHQMWIDVFSPKYGDAGEPPYDVVKIPTVVVSKTALTDWLNGIGDLELRGRFNEWLTKYNKKSLPTIYLNESYVMGSGIPEEILPVIDLKRIVFDTTMQHRLILASLGMLLNENLMVHEQFSE